MILIDTDIRIDAGRNIRDALACLRDIEQRSTLAISTVTHLELIVGCRNKTELRALDRFLSRFQIVKLNEQISDAAVDLLKQYRLSHGLLIADSLIAATAIALNYPLATKNQRDFQFVAGLQLLSYPRPFAPAP